MNTDDTGKNNGGCKVQDTSVRASSRPSWRRAVVPLALLGLLLSTSGCLSIQRVNFAWAEYPIGAGKRQALPLKTPIGRVTLSSGEADPDWREIGRDGKYRYFFTDQRLSDAIVTQLGHELDKFGARRVEGSRKSLTVRVVGTRSQSSAFRSMARLDFEVQIGDGVVREFSAVRELAGPPSTAFNRVIMEAVLVILRDSQIAAFLSQ